MLVPFIDTPDSDARADVLFVAASLWPARPVRRALFVSDVFLRVFAEDDPVPPDERFDVSPSQDLRSVEALAFIYVERVESDDFLPRLWLGTFAYGFDDEGRFHWLDERAPGWTEHDLTEHPPSRMQMAVMSTTFGDRELIEHELRGRLS
jgi:hypothetical protein